MKKVVLLIIAALMMSAVANADTTDRGKKNKKKNDNKLLKNEEDDKPLIEPFLPKDKTSDEVLSKLKDLLSINPNDNSIKKCIDVYENDIKKHHNED